MCLDCSWSQFQVADSSSRVGLQGERANALEFSRGGGLAVMST